MGTLIMIGQIFLALGILVTLHELGHFLAARMFKIRVDKFYLFFDFLFPLPNVLNFALFKKKVGDTEYGLGWFPMGGYVQIAGMVDEQLDKEALAQPAKPDEFRAKKPWQRLIVLLGGIIVNIILGVIIFIGIKYTWGDSYIPLKTINSKFGIYASDIAEKEGFKTGDKLISVNGKNLEYLSQMFKNDVLFGDNQKIKVERNGQIAEFGLSKDFLNNLSSAKKQGFISEAYEFSVGEVQKKSEAEKIGLKTGDKIIEINKLSVHFFQDLTKYLKANANSAIDLKIVRGSDTLKKRANIGKDGVLGFIAENITFDPKKDAVYIKYSFGESITNGTNAAFDALWGNVLGLGKLFTGKVDAAKSVSGPVGIARLFGSTWDWENFWKLTGILSLGLALMNLLPIPGLDGGHSMFVLYEMLTGRQPNEKLQYVLQVVGVVIILSLMVLIFGLDIYKLITGQ